MKSIKLLLNQKWAKKFFTQKVPHYFPKKKLINLQIKPLKIYLNYKSIVVKYCLELLGEGKNICKKNIIGKAERIDSKSLKSREKNGIWIDYSTTKFLEKQGLKDLITKPFDYLPSFNLYLNEFLPGYFLQELSMSNKDKEFLNKIPAVAEAIKKIHRVEVGEKDKIIRRDRRWEERAWERDLKIVQQYQPLIFDKVLFWVKECRFLRDKYRKYFNSNFYRMTHGDFYSRNIIISRGRIKLIDFSDGAFYDPLNDIADFLINTELMFEYDFHNNYRQLIERVKNIFFKNYFSQPMEKEQEFKINYFILTNLIRIIAFAAMSEGNKKLASQSAIVIDKLMKFGEEKYNNL